MSYQAVFDCVTLLQKLAVGGSTHANSIITAKLQRKNVEGRMGRRNVSGVSVFTALHGMQT